MKGEEEAKESHAPRGMLGGVREAPRSPGSRGRVWGGPPGSSDPARNDAPCPHDLVAVKPIWGPDFGFFGTLRTVLPSVLKGGRGLGSGVVRAF